MGNGFSLRPSVTAPPDIYRVHPDGTGLDRLTDDAAFDDQAALSPDGSLLAFVSTRGAGTADIWVLDLKSHKLRNLTRGAAAIFDPNGRATDDGSRSLRSEHCGQAPERSRF